MLLRITARWSRGGKSLHDPRSNHGPVILSISSARQPAGMVLAAAARIDQDDIDQHRSARFRAKTAYSSPVAPDSAHLPSDSIQLQWRPWGHTSFTAYHASRPAARHTARPSRRSGLDQIDIRCASLRQRQEPS
jgi:hypothetical protein